MEVLYITEGEGVCVYVFVCVCIYIKPLKDPYFFQNCLVANVNWMYKYKYTITPLIEMQTVILNNILVQKLQVVTPMYNLTFFGSY